MSAKIASYASTTIKDTGTVKPCMRLLLSVVQKYNYAPIR